MSERAARLRPLPRLSLDLAAAAFLLMAFAYWWLGNLAHELFGTTFFLVLVRHVANNRAWWGAVRRGRYDARRTASLVLTLLLAVAMAVLLATSLAISRTVFAVLPLPDAFSLREAHWFAAYWVVALVGLHLGLNWPKVSRLLKRVTGLSLAARGWRVAGMVLAAGIAVLGVGSGSALGLWPRLAFRYSLVMWDFNAALLPFFGHWLAVVGLFAVAGHMAMRLVEVAGAAAARRE
ncbi:DUF4405 domain-containing protein [Acuticoccus sp. I52.16.1]|uniref:DUF4405 domain-containing protein n=1 Tax=Acuticoccus sp. I52.16.1 TaxID=2928472 RepID=UPI001FD1E1C3|nr:DUF4405 domain-containing protein [Acuticoccus sp. I52.16.1]UOM35046.1 DUF4405 domain-containing protein [Acuticoccus sp. I52.16.1]